MKPEIEKGNQIFRDNCVIRSFGKEYKLKFYPVSDKKYSIELLSMSRSYSNEIIGEFYKDGKFTTNYRLWHAELIS